MVHGAEPLDTRILGAVYHREGDIVYAKGPERAVVVVEGHDILLDAEALYNLLTVALGLARDDDDGAREVYLLGRSLEVAQRPGQICNIADLGIIQTDDNILGLNTGPVSSTVLLNEMVGGAFLFYMAATIARKGGVHILICEDRDAAAYALNDLYALLC